MALLIVKVAYPWVRRTLHWKLYGERACVSFLK